jgi:hypothetical protein
MSAPPHLPPAHDGVEVGFSEDEMVNGIEEALDLCS